LPLGSKGHKVKAELRPRKLYSSLRFKCNSLLHLNRGLPGSAVYDLSIGRHRVPTLAGRGQATPIRFARGIRLKRQDNFASALARLKVTGRLGDFCGRERLVYERSVFLRGSERDNFLVVLARTFRRLQEDVETEDRRCIPDKVERVNGQRHAGTVTEMNQTSEARMSNVQLGTSFDDLPCNVLSWFAARDS
jgi:hypothetical protein